MGRLHQKAMLIKGEGARVPAKEIKKAAEPIAKKPVSEAELDKTRRQLEARRTDG